MSEPATLHFAADLPALAVLLDQRLAAWRTPERGPFAPVFVVTAHRAMREWLKRELAALRGGVANLKFLSPGQVLARCGRSGGAVLGALHRELGDATPYAPARQYVDHDGPDENRRELRRYTLASRLSAQFQTYASNSFTPTGDDWRTQLYAKAAPALALAAPEAPLDGPLFVFELPVPGFDFIDATARLGVERHVFLRAHPEAAEGSLWLRHGRQLHLAEQRWRARGATVGTKAEPLSTKRPDVTLFEAPSLRRACEVAAAQLWGWARDEGASPRVRFHEMAIVVPSGLREKLLPTLREVLEEAHALPKVVWNVPLGPNNRVATLAQQLLELPSTGLRRAEVLSVLTHPLVSGAFGDDLPEAWAEWLDAVGIFHGLDASSHEGTYLAGKQVAHWDQGLTRLALGAFLGAERSGEVARLQLGEWTIEPEELSQSSLPSLGLLLRFVRSLLGDATAIKQARLPAAEWKALLVAYLDAYLRPPEDADRRIRNAVLRQLDAFDDLGLEGAFGWEVAKAVALGAVGGASGALGTHFGVGVVIGTPEDLAGLSFRRLVFLGLEEGTFPSKSRLSELDQRIDDEGRAREEMRPDDARLIDARNFFDLVQAATGPVCLVPIARDPLTAARREPSSLVKDLAFELQQAGQALEGIALPLHRREDVETAAERAARKAPDPAESPVRAAMTWTFPGARVEQAIFAVGRELTGGGEPLPAFSRFTPEWQQLLGRAPMPTPKPGAAQVLEVPLSRLVQALEYPTQAYAAQRLKLSREEDDTGGISDEPFEHSGRSSSVLLSGALGALLSRYTRAELEKRDASLVRAAYETARERLEAAGQLAVGRFGELQREQDLVALEGVLTTCLEQAEFQPRYHRLRWGPATFNRDEARPLAPIERKVQVRGADVTVRITGLSSWLSEDRAALWRFKNSLSKSKPYATGLHRRYGLHAWVEHLLLQVGDVPRSRLAMLICRDTRWHGWTLPDVPPSPAGAMLDQLLVGLLEQRIGFKLPTVALLQHWAGLGPSLGWPQRLALLSTAADDVLAPRGADNERYGVVARVRELRLPDEDEFERVRARFEGWMAGREADELAREEEARLKARLKRAERTAAAAAELEARRLRREAFLPPGAAPAPAKKKPSARKSTSGGKPS